MWDETCCWSRVDRVIESKKKVDFEFENEPDDEKESEEEEEEEEEEDEEDKLLDTGEFILRPPYK